MVATHKGTSFAVSSKEVLRGLRNDARDILRRPNPEKAQAMRQQLQAMESNFATTKEAFTKGFDTLGPAGFVSSPYKETDIPEGILDTWIPKLMPTKHADFLKLKEKGL